MKALGVIAGLLPALFVLTALPAEAAESASAAGYWEGSISMPEDEMGIYIELEVSAAGAWSGRIDVPVQGVRNIALEKFAIEGRSIRFEMANVQGDPTFIGDLSEDGRSITGRFEQMGRPFPFSLIRLDTPREDDSDIFAEYEKPGVPGEGLAGHWRGIMRAGLSKLRMDLHIEQAEDGTLGATISSPDQKSADLLADEVSYEDGTLRFTVNAIYGHYEARLSPDGSTLLGQWLQQRPFSLDFRRQASEPER